MKFIFKTAAAYKHIIPPWSHLTCNSLAAICAILQAYLAMQLYRAKTYSWKPKYICILIRSDDALGKSVIVVSQLERDVQLNMYI